MSRSSQVTRAPITTSASAQVFTTVLTQGPLSRLEVARITGLSSAAVTKAARPFIDAGYLEELPFEDRTGRGAGRPASPLGIRPDREFFVGVKVAGEELIGVVADLASKVHWSMHRRLESTLVPDVVADIAELVKQMRAQTAAYTERSHCLGVAVSGDIDRASGTVRYSPFLGWRDAPLASLLSEATGLVVTIENDVKALAAAEHLFGEGVGMSNFALVTVGSGIGCALVINGALVAGARGVAGEIGHMPVAADGPDCHCGGFGCVEAIASTKAIVIKAREVSGDHSLTIEQAADLARSGHTPLLRLFEDVGQAIGRALAGMANLTGPEKIIVSGEGLAAYDLLQESIRSAFVRQAFGATAYCPLILRPLPFEEWARGAAAVAVQELVTLTDGQPLV